MTLLDIATYCASSLGLNDNLTLTQAKKFAALRWKMIWDAANWNLSRGQAAVAIVGGTETAVMPSDVQLVLAVRIGTDRELLPSHDLTELALNPAAFGSVGETLTFSQAGKDGSGNVQIRLHRPTTQAATLLVLYKKKCTELVADGDTPLIPGVDQCLIAFALGDLYRWQRQHSKANNLYMEANAHLGKMIELETVQSGRIARIIPYDCAGVSDGDNYLTK